MLIVPCMIVILFSEDSKDVDISKEEKKTDLWIKDNFFKAFSTIFRLPRFGLIVLVIGFYKVSDGYLDAMLIPFLTDIGFSKKEIAEFSNTISIIAHVLGSFVGSYFIGRFNLVRVLIGAEFFSAITNLLFIPLFYVGKNDMLLALVTFFESFCSAICNITLITYMSMLCGKRFTATHYSILISISGFTRLFLSSSSGFVALKLGWVKFFIVSSLFSLPSLACICILYRLRMVK